MRDAAGVTVRIVRSDATRWASATFAGARHELVLRGQTQARRSTHWLAALPEAELPLRGHLVADLKIVAVQRVDDGDDASRSRR